MALGRRRHRPEHSVRLPWEDRRGIRRFFERSRLALFVGALVLALVATLIARAAGSREARRDTLKTIGTVHAAISRFRMDVGRCPRSMNELMHPPRGRSTYLHGEPKDAWGRAFHIECPAPGDPDAALVISAGPSGDFQQNDNLH